MKNLFLLLLLFVSSSVQTFAASSGDHVCWCYCAIKSFDGKYEEPSGDQVIFGKILTQATPKGRVIRVVTGGARACSVYNEGPDGSPRECSGQVDGEEKSGYFWCYDRVMGNADASEILIE